MKKIFQVMQKKNQKGYSSIKDILVDTFTQLEQLYNQKQHITGVPTGFADLDYKTASTFIESGGYKIYTTQDTGIQSKMEEVYRSDDYVFSGRQKDSDGNLYNNHTQSAMVIMDHKTGKVVGCMGGLGTDVDSNGINRATQTKRQPGSSM